MNAIIGLYRHPFSSGPVATFAFEPGQTLGEMVAATPTLPANFERYGTICINDVPINRKHWNHIRPKPGRRVTFHYMPLQGGGGGGKKAVLGIIVAIATVLTAGLATSGFFATGGLFLAGSTSANLLAAGISIIGSLAASALSAPPASPGLGADGPGLGQDRGPASLSGNVLRPGGAIPRVVGTRWIYPPLACQPLVVRDGLDEWVEGLFVLAGAHKVDEIRIGDAPIDEAEDVEYRVLEGWPEDPAMRLVQRYAATKDLRLELSSHQIDSNDYVSLVNQAFPERSLPKWHTTASSRDCDEIWLHLQMPGGLNYLQDPDVRLMVPIRVRMKNNDTGIVYNLPEFIFSSKSASELKPTIMIRWKTTLQAQTVPSSEGFVAAYKHVAGQAEPSTDAWEAHSSFSKGAGNDGLYSGTEGTSNVAGVILSEHEAAVFLDETQIPKGEYQIEVKRGAAVNAASFNKATHQVDGQDYDLFHFIKSGEFFRLAWSREYCNDRLYFARAASVFNSHPVNGGKPGSGLCLIAIRALNRDVSSLAVKASGWVQDWSDETQSWSEWVYGGQYLAAHYRDILRGSLTPDPIDAENIDEDSLLEWREHCIDRGYTCDLICEGAGIDEVLTKIAGCGYGRPRYSEVWGVIIDRDTSDEEPVQIFSSRNSAGLSMAKGFARVPDALRVSYRNADDLDQSQEIIVWRPGSEGVANPRLEAVEYEGLVEKGKVISRASYDLAQTVSRSAFWSWRAPLEAIVCTRGDLVGLNHDVIDRTHSSARIIDIYVEDGAITGIELDSEAPIWNEPDMHGVADMHSVADMQTVGLTSHLSIRRADGSDSVHEIAGVSGYRATAMFATPAAIEFWDVDGEPLVREGNLVKIGRAGNIAMRLKISDITYDKDHFASITAVAEAPELWAA